MKSEIKFLTFVLTATLEINTNWRMKLLNPSCSALFHMKTRVCLKYDCP